MNYTSWKSFTATLLANGKVLVTGGGMGDFGGSISSADLYDPDTGTWSATGSMEEQKENHTATLLPNGMALVAGGYYFPDYTGPHPPPHVLSSAELYDPGTETWSATGFMAEARDYHTATLLQNGKVLVAGGQEYKSGIGYTTFSSAELFDPGTGIWSTTGSMATSRGEHTATLLPDGKVLVAGGHADGDILSSAELYTPAAWE
jgi:hypothetical protein